jgi:CrcB protein
LRANPTRYEFARSGPLIDLRVVLAVGLGAAIGGMLRLLLTQLAVARLGAGSAFYATLFINVSGSFLIGVVIALSQGRADFNPLWRWFLATGILGGYTTFSTFSYEAIVLGGEGLYLTAAGYVLGSAVLGIGGAAAGVALAKSLVR